MTAAGAEFFVAQDITFAAIRVGVVADHIAILGGEPPGVWP